MPKRDDLEYKALHFIVSTRNQGVLQADLWRKLGASSREGSRIALKLENKGLIRREKVLFDGRWTYKLLPKKLPASINSVIECPCLMCPNDARCGAYGAISPNECERLTEWVVTLSKGEMAETDPSGEG
jgi:DNA-binding Lrp family transcriptional regulator